MFLQRLRPFIVIAFFAAFSFWWFEMHNSIDESALYPHEDYVKDASTIYFDLGNMLEKVHDYDGAIKAYTTAVTINPQFSKALSCLGMAYEHVGDMVNAHKTHAQAMRLDPNFSKTCT